MHIYTAIQFVQIHFLTPFKTHIPHTVVTAMLFKPNLVAAAVAFGVISGTTAVAADDKPIQNDLSNDAQPLVTGPKLHEGMKHAGAGLRIAYRRLIAAAAEDSEDPEEIEVSKPIGFSTVPVESPNVPSRT